MDQDPMSRIGDLLILPEVQEILESSTSRDEVIAADNTFKPNARKDEQKAPENEKYKCQDVAPPFEGSDPLSLVSSLSESTTVTISESDSTASQSCHLRSNQHLPELNAAMDDLRSKIPTKIASLRRIVVEKEREALQQQQIRELEAELHHLKQVEVQLAQYEKMPVEALEKELETLQQQVTDLSKQIESALQNEFQFKQSRKFLH